MIPDLEPENSAAQKVSDWFRERSDCISRLRVKYDTLHLLQCIKYGTRDQERGDSSGDDVVDYVSGYVR